MSRRSGLLASLLVPLFTLGAVAAPSCKPVEGTPLPSGPVNLCGAGVKQCSDYAIGATDAGSDGGPGCSALDDNGLSLPQADKKLRCNYGTPAFSYSVVVNVPDSSIYAAGRTFVFSRSDLSTRPAVPNPQCTRPACIPLANLVTGTGQYLVTQGAAQILGLKIDGPSVSVPVQARLIPFAPGATAEAVSLGLPLPDLYTTSGNLGTPGSATLQVIWSTSVAIGTYERIYYPAPPFDAFIPPSFSTNPGLTVNDGFNDFVTLGTSDEVKNLAAKSELDDESGEFRKTTIGRRDGLDGWHVWIEEQNTRRRISTIKTLSGTNDTEVLHTLGFRQAAAPSLVDDVDLVISPPDNYLAVPKLVSPIINGSSIGFRNVEFPVLPAPVTFPGVVVSGDPGSLVGFPASISFTSSGLLKTTSSSTTTVSDETLQYFTVVNTDDKGQFTTVLPQGTYDVIVEPIEGTGFAKFKTTVDTLSRAATLRPPKRTIVTGRAILADGRPLAEATLSARPALGVDLGKTGVSPRAAVAQTAPDGTFQFEADQGTYDLMTDPQVGTVFPRVVQRLTVGGETQVVPDVVVPPGGRIALTIRDPSVVSNPIAHALVRVFAEYPGQAGPSVEIASGTTDASGYVEISLAPQTR